LFRAQWSVERAAKRAVCDDGRARDDVAVWRDPTGRTYSSALERPGHATERPVALARGNTAALPARRTLTLNAP